MNGFANPRYRFSINLFGAPALSLQQFRDYQQDLVIGASVQVQAPMSQYNGDRLLNLGTNRWFVKPGVGVTKVLGRWTLELAAGATFYGDNDNFFGGKLREQDPLFSLQGYIIYQFKSGIWLALDGTFYTGGRTTTNGLESDDRQESTRYGATLSLPINRNNSVKLFASTGATAHIGSDFDTAGVAWQYRWGGGL